MDKIDRYLKKVEENSDPLNKKLQNEIERFKNLMKYSDSDIMRINSNERIVSENSAYKNTISDMRKAILERKLGYFTETEFIDHYERALEPKNKILKIREESDLGTYVEKRSFLGKRIIPTLSKFKEFGFKNLHFDMLIDVIEAHTERQGKATKLKYFMESILGSYDETELTMATKDYDKFKTLLDELNEAEDLRRELHESGLTLISYNTSFKYLKHLGKNEILNILEKIKDEDITPVQKKYLLDTIIDATSKKECLPETILDFLEKRFDNLERVFEEVVFGQIATENDF